MTPHQLETELRVAKDALRVDMRLSHGEDLIISMLLALLQHAADKEAERKS